MYRYATLLLSLFLLSCADKPHQAPPIGEAYVGPSTLNLREELTPKAAVSAVVKHGDKLDILESKRRFVKVRGPNGGEGWTDSRQLLTPPQMAALRQLAESGARSPSQGAATVFEPLNIHTEPSRVSPIFWQIPENGIVDVIGHRLAPRSGGTRTSAAASAAKPKPAPRRKGKQQRPAASQKTTAPPPPSPPKPPENWLDLSVPKEDDLEPEKPVGRPDATQPSVVMEDWSLVRTKEGRVGWVLERNLIMAIPDEVAQYAEGHRITSYFPMGEVQDGEDGVKKNWLWTTIARGREPYEFDSFRVFVWSRKRHHYETAFIERKVRGHFPVSVDAAGAVPSFSVVVEGEDGQLLRKTYTFAGYHVRMVDKSPYEAPRASEQPHVAAVPATPPRAKASWFARAKDRVHRLLH